MPLEPDEWNVIVVGRWNRAILTPQGIASRLFQVPAQTEIGIEVPMDAIGPYRVSHNDLTVMVVSSHLIVEARENNFPSLERAMRVARRAMESLPETPVLAAGYNIRAHGAGEDEQLAPLIAATQFQWDQQFEREGLPIFKRDVTWVVDWHAGKISVNLSRAEHDRVLHVHLNFERTGSRQELMDWLARPVEEVRGQASHIVADVFHLPREATPWTQ